MSSGNKTKRNIVKPAVGDIDDTTFERLMRRSGIKRLASKETSADQPAQMPEENAGIEFEDAFDWRWEINRIATSGKFSGRPKRLRPALKRKRKVSRNFSPDEVLDLHGETKPDALDRVHRKMQTAESDGYQSLLIITGKGMNSKKKGGVLGSAVWEWLDQYQLDHPIRFQWAPPHLGGKGAILVFL